MASGDHRPKAPTLDGSALRIGVVSSRWNADIIDRLLEGVDRGLNAAGVTQITRETVPGAFELPLAALMLARSTTVDGIVAIGTVIRGETTHYELVAEECGRGLMDVQLTTQIPVGLGILTVENHDQAVARSEAAGGHNVGEEAALVAVELALLAARYER